MRIFSVCFRRSFLRYLQIIQAFRELNRSHAAVKAAIPAKPSRSVPLFKPIFRFAALFQRDLELGNKIRFAVRIVCFSDIGADTRRRSFQIMKYPKTRRKLPITAEYWNKTTTEITKAQILIWAAWAKYYRENPDRLRHPLKRVGGEFVEISWDQAMQEIGAKTKEQAMADRAGMQQEILERVQAMFNSKFIYEAYFRDIKFQ